MPSFGVIVISESFSCFGTSIVKFPLSSDVTLCSVPSFNLIVTSVFGVVFPLTVVVALDGSFSALPSVIVGFVSAVLSNAASASFNAFNASSISFCNAFGSSRTFFALSKAVS